MFKRRMLKVFSVFLVCLLLASCATGTRATMRSEPVTLSADRLAAIKNEEIYPDAPIELVRFYHDVQELYDDATIVIQGTLDHIERKGTGFDGGLSTQEEFIYSTFNVEEAIKGSIEKGDQVTVRDVGSGDYVVGGVPLYDEDHSYILFLLESEGEHFVVGAFQGRFVIREGYAFQQTIEPAQLADYTPLKADEFIAQIPAP